MNATFLRLSVDKNVACPYFCIFSNIKEASEPIVGTYQFKWDFSNEDLN